MDYLITFQDGQQVEITEVKEVNQKFGFLEFRAFGPNQYTKGSDLPLIIAYRADQIKCYEPAENARPHILPQVNSIVKPVFTNRKYTKRTKK